MGSHWYNVTDADTVLTPQLLFYPDRIAENIGQMLRIAGSPDRLRPHIKTFKCREIVRMMLDAKINKFKCATIVEARLLAELDVPDVLVAYPLIGPAQKQFHALRKAHPSTRFSVLIDNESQLSSWNKHEIAIDLFIDVNVGMNRTGIDPKLAAVLYNAVNSSAHKFRGWHCYDGHIRTHSVSERRSEVVQEFIEVNGLIEQTMTGDMELVCGGSITFPIHAEHASRTLSPGTTLLWDRGYSMNFPDLPFSIAAAMATRVISKPGTDLVCLDCGHKAVASEMKAAPLYIPEIPDAEIRTHSEEHLVVHTSAADDLEIGQIVYGYPHHICPTVALHESVGVIEGGELRDRWQIRARKRLYE